MIKMMEGRKNDLMATKGKLGEMEDSLNAVKIKLREVDFKQRDQTLTTSGDEIRVAEDEVTPENQITRHGATNEEPRIVVTGGLNDDNVPLNSMEVFDWSTRSWSQLQPMKKYRLGATSFVYENQITVTGGWTDDGITNSMEQINIGPGLDHSAQQWHVFPGKLPSKLSAHKTLVFNERLVVIGGFKDGRDCSDSIHEVQLHPPYTTHLLATMPQPRVYHGVELFDDKIFILGGSETGTFKDSVDSVLVYDINNNECQQMTSLPFPVHYMATVKWGDSVILLGGRDKVGNFLNTVVIYDVKTGKSDKLPEMKYKRAGSVAVASEKSIVVIGGEDEESNFIKSVEFFTFERYTWEDLPPMNEDRYGHTALAL